MLNGKDILKLMANVVKDEEDLLLELLGISKFAIDGYNSYVSWMSDFQFLKLKTILSAPKMTHELFLFIDKDYMKCKKIAKPSVEEKSSWEKNTIKYRESLDFIRVFRNFEAHYLSSTVKKRMKKIREYIENSEINHLKDFIPAYSIFLFGSEIDIDELEAKTWDLYNVIKEMFNVYCTYLKGVLDYVINKYIDDEDALSEMVTWREGIEEMISKMNEMFHKFEEDFELLFAAALINSAKKIEDQDLDELTAQMNEIWKSE